MTTARRRRVTEPMPLPREEATRPPRRDPSVTLLGLNCFRLVRIADPDTGEPGYVPVRRLASGTPMGPLTRR
jgi:hypothetical protein